MNYSKHTYYAHSMQIYNTDQEKREYDQLNKLGFNIVCPNRDLSLGNEMSRYLRIVAKCKDLVASEYSGFIGKGVYLEIRWALRHEIPVYVLRKGSVFIVKNVKQFNTDDWKTTFGKIGEVEPVEVEEECDATESDIY